MPSIFARATLSGCSPLWDLAAASSASIEATSSALEDMVTIYRNDVQWEVCEKLGVDLVGTYTAVSAPLDEAIANPANV